MDVQQLSQTMDAFIVRMPKVELHLHLEGTIQPATLLEIARRNQVEIPAKDEAGVAQLLQYRNFQDFLTVFMALARALVRGEDFEQLAVDLGHHLADQNVLYAEVMISPALYYNRGLDLDEVVQGAAAGFARAGRERGVRVNLAFDYGRQFGVETAWRILEVATRNRPHRLVAWSIGGDELNYPPELYAEVFAEARRAGLRTMAHAGEVVGPPSVWGAVEALEAERLGHGIHSIGDPTLLDCLRERRVTLDISPTSNLRTGAVADIASHPLRRLYESGVTVTLNSDDPTFFDTTLTDEFRLAVRDFGFDAAGLSQLVLNAAGAAFLPAEERDELVRRCAVELDALRAELGV